MELDLMMRVMRMRWLTIVMRRLRFTTAIWMVMKTRNLVELMKMFLTLMGKHLVTHPMPVHLCSMAMHNILKT